VEERHRELLHAGYAALSRGDLDEALAHMDPSVEVVTSGAFLDEGVVYRGHEGVREFIGMLTDAFDELVYEPVELHDAADGRILVHVRLRGRGKGSGLEVDREGGHIWTLRGDTAVRLEAYPSPEDARAAAGLT
jgi:ketosteroid isomerase-like protein